jgi:type II secretory pathway component PulK
MHHNSQQGFVLVLTLWILAIITVGAAYFAERVARSVALARQSQLATQALLDFSSTRAEILFRLGTTRFSIYGLGPTPQDAIALDNRPYHGTGDDLVRLQDSRGLININFIQPEMLRLLLGQMGVAAENRDALLDSLNDYTDTDDLRRLNGAESAEYRARGWPLPPNDWLVTPGQLQSIIGWREQAILWKDQRLLDIVTTARVIGFNPNTAPREVLAVLPSSTPEIADALIKMRALQPLANLFQLGSLAGQIGLDSESQIFFPSDNIRLTQESDKVPWSLRYQISLTPFADYAPWRIDYYLKTGVTSPTQNAPKTFSPTHPLSVSTPTPPPPLPDRVTLPATSIEEL